MDQKLEYAVNYALAFLTDVCANDDNYPHLKKAEQIEVLYKAFELMKKEITEKDVK